MQVRFWGTRGSLAKPGPTTLRYGGNTSCVEVRSASGTTVVLDCGTGSHALGQALVAARRDQLFRGYLLITHTHWDHIQGFPFFAPLFDPGFEWHIYAPGAVGHNLEATLAGQMEYTYFPVTLEQLGARILYHDLVEGTFRLDGIQVTTRFLNHPALALGYRLEVGGATVVYAVDHEPHARYELEAPSADLMPVHQEDRRHVEFLAGADLVIHDAQYTAQEYSNKVGWGHTAAEQAVDFAVAAGAKRLALFHHDPLRGDDALDRLVETCRSRVAQRNSTLDVFAAAEQQIIELPEQAHPMEAAESEELGALGSAVRVAGSIDGGGTVLVADDDPAIVALLTAALEPEGFRLFSAWDGESTLRMAREVRPDLILLDWHMPGPDGLQVCRILREDPEPRLRDVPLVLLTSQPSPEETAAGFAAGASDFVTKPFTVAYVRTRVRGWLLRSRVGSSAKP